MQASIDKGEYRREGRQQRTDGRGGAGLTDRLAGIDANFGMQQGPAKLDGRPNAQQAYFLGLAPQGQIESFGFQINGITLTKTSFLTVTTFTAFYSLLTAPTVRAAGMTKGHPVAPFTPDLKPGDYVWLPEISPAGPVVIVVSLSEQLLYVYRNGVRIGRSSISSGKTGHKTPTGVFTILQKNVQHTSTIYKDASMPYMERLTWGGVAIHAGNLPGYPAAHGCVRLPLDFARQLYTVTQDGTTVIVTDAQSTPGSTVAPGLLFSTAPSEAAPVGGVVWNPAKEPKGPVSVILSRADGAAYVYRNGVEIGRAPVAGLRDFTGSYVYSALTKVDAAGRRDWLSMASVGGRPPDMKAVVKQAGVDPQFLANVRVLITPGTILILTDAPVTVSTRSGSGFNILTTSETP